MGDVSKLSTLNLANGETAVQEISWSILTSETHCFQFFLQNHGDLRLIDQWP